jgi:hypothetical protein
MIIWLMWLHVMRLRMVVRFHRGIIIRCVWLHVMRLWMVGWLFGFICWSVVLGFGLMISLHWFVIIRLWLMINRLWFVISRHWFMISRLWLMVGRLWLVISRLMISRFWIMVGRLWLVISRLMISRFWLMVGRLGLVISRLMISRFWLMVGGLGLLISRLVISRFGLMVCRLNLVVLRRVDWLMISRLGWMIAWFWCHIEWSMSMFHVPILVVVLGIIIRHGKAKHHLHAERVSFKVGIIVGLWCMICRLWRIVLCMQIKDVLQRTTV